MHAAADTTEVYLRIVLVQGGGGWGGEDAIREAAAFRGLSMHVSSSLSHHKAACRCTHRLSELSTLAHRLRSPHSTGPFDAFPEPLRPGRWNGPTDIERGRERRREVERLLLFELDGDFAALPAPPLP